MTGKPPSSPKARAAAERQARLARELRANLVKRKRRGPSKPQPGEGAGTEPGALPAGRRRVRTERSRGRSGRRRPHPVSVRG